MKEQNFFMKNTENSKLLLHHFLPNWERYLLMSIVPIYFMLISITQQNPLSIFEGVREIIVQPDILITDYFVVGGVGAAFFNAGCLTIISLGLLCIAKSNFDGSCIMASCLMFGFSLFGKNLLNIWAIILGYALYAKIHRVPFRKYLHIGLCGTTLSPIITQILLIPNIPDVLQLLLALAVGLVIGYVLVPISLHTKHAHMGYSLYNAGFACGIIATIVISLMKSFGVKIESRLVWDTDHRLFGFYSLLALFLVLMLLSLFFGRKETILGYRDILKESGQGNPDYLKKYGDYPTIFNMGVNGLAMTLILYILGGDFNGPTIGSIFCLVGFSATGKHLRNILPVIFGVILAGFLKVWSVQDPSSTLTLILVTTLAPIAGEFGIFWGIAAGFLHSSVALNVGILYNGTNLYNNGFAGGVVAIFLVPIILAIKDRQKPMAIYDEEAKKLAIKDKLFDKPEVKLPKNIFWK